MKHNSNDMDYSNRMDGGSDYEHVDLGLPSGTLWATCNVGATSPEQAGLYFAFGETTGYTAEQVKNGECSFDDDLYKTVKISGNLTLEQDAANHYMGGKWRMPTYDDWQELFDYCDDAWTYDYNSTGVAGCIFTSKINGNSVFFPAAGYCYYSSVYNVGSEGEYWSASCAMLLNAWFISFHSGGVGVNHYYKWYGHPVRGVRKK